MDVELTFLDRIKNIVYNQNPDIHGFCNEIVNLRTIIKHNPHIINDIDINGNTALIIICRNPINNSISKQLIELLIEFGANLEIKNNSELTALMSACIFDNTGMLIKDLINVGAKLDTRGHHDYTALMVSCMFANITAIRILVSASCNVNLCDRTGRTPLMLLCTCNCSDLRSSIKLLINNSADVNLRDKAGKNVIQLTYQYNKTMYQEDIINYLINIDSDINIRAKLQDLHI